MGPVGDVGFRRVVVRAAVEGKRSEGEAEGYVAGGERSGNGEGVESAWKGDEEEEGWAHSDVAESNVESAGVARGLGGKVGWRVRWVGVDLGLVRDVVCRQGEGRKMGGPGDVNSLDM